MPDPKPDETAPTPEDTKAQPGTAEGTGHFAVFDRNLNQFVSGVGDKATANAAKKELESHNGTVTEGHTLDVLEV